VGGRIIMRIREGKKEKKFPAKFPAKLGESITRKKKFFDSLLLCNAKWCSQFDVVDNETQSH